MKSSDASPRSGSWNESIAYTFFLFVLSAVTIPLTRFLINAGIYSYLFCGIFGLIAVSGISFLVLKFRKLGLGRTLGFILIVGIYGVLYRISTYDSEKLHLVTYSAAVWIYSRKLSIKKAWGLVLIVAVLDETLQHFIPGRFFQLYDIFLNAAAGLLALGLIRILRPAFQRL